MRSLYGAIKKIFKHQKQKAMALVVPSDYMTGERSVRRMWLTGVLGIDNPGIVKCTLAGIEVGAGLG
jgi:hypothetical protein